MEKIEYFVGENKVKDIEVTDIKTPLGDDILNVTFEEADPVELTKRKFECIRTLEKSDANKAREALVKEVGGRMYSLLMEYGATVLEVDPILNETARLVNDGQSHALDILWGKDMYTRSLIDVNRVLVSKYGAESKNKEGGDGAASDGGTADRADA